VFGKLMDNIAFNNAVALTVKMLRAHSVGPCPFDPEVHARNAVAMVQYVRSDVVGGGAFKRLSTNTLAMMALAAMVEDSEGNSEAQLIMALALGRLLQEVAAMGMTGRLPPYEMGYFLTAEGIYSRVMEARQPQQDAALHSLDRVIPGQPIGSGAALPHNPDDRLAVLERGLSSFERSLKRRAAGES